MNYLKIKNFGPVKDATIELKPFLVLIGGQGTGKSTIAKLLSIFQDYLWYIALLQENENINVPFIEYGISKYFNKNTYFEYNCNDISITYKEGKFNLEHKRFNNKENLQSFCGNIIAEKINSLRIKMGFPAEQPIETFIEKNISFIKNYCATALYIPAERNIAGTFSNALASMIVANIPIAPLLVRYISYFERARNEFPEYTLPIMGGIVYKYNEKEEGIVISQGDESKIIPLSQCSSGLQSLLPMMMILDYCIREEMFDSYVIEEPEQNLFPDNQLSVLRHIVGKRNSQNNSCIITTHSPYLLSGINISLMAGQVAQCKEYSDEVSDILPSEYHLTPGSVAAYALGDADNYCKDIINPQTGTIDQNYLDTTSTVIGQEFSKLYKLYIKTLR